MKGVLLINLGSPDSPDQKDVKKYLDEFLMDQHVIDVPYLLRLFLVKGIILNTRPKKSAEAYKKVWTCEGSPLIVYTEKLQKKIQNLVSIPVEIAMRYANPSIQKGLGDLYKRGIRDVLIIPLYPQYSMATTESVIVKSQEVKNAYYRDMTFTIVPPFYNKPDYISVLSNSISKNLEDFKYDHLLFSYHGIPERHIYKTDPTKSHCKIDKACCVIDSKAHENCYRHQCFETTKLIAKELNLKENSYSNSFQSRLGSDPWLQPYTAEQLEKFPLEGIKNLAVVTPAFVSDCLETIEEIGMEGKKDFLERGGQEFKMIPCLNDDTQWAEVLAKWINEWL
ncbi:ferrochelatase [Ichthyobacterium seriolicida]|uniref:Ferrochelatase n=1 Tax=Ichthyobacterium seriolicida TaxID=242600 RepID=A0A1J1E3R8_9FLAO|nr:ferrochelatase [Ichthyobacterium seriolicida]BAV94700.1 ferrochelatase [Ichthyobacterium seriolicida]